MNDRYRRTPEEEQTLMPARNPYTRVLVALCALTAAFALSASAASAKVFNPLIGSFGEFGDMVAITVEQSTQDVYVQNGGILEKFDATGEPVNFASTGTNKVEDYSGEWEMSEVAVDESGGPANGNIYTTGSFELLITFNAAGELLGLLGSSEIPGQHPCGVTVDGAGNVYLGTLEGLIDKFHAPSSGVLTAEDFVSSINVGGSPCNLAVDSAGNVYETQYSAGSVTRYDPMQFGAMLPVGARVDGAGASFAVDRKTDEVYVNEQNRVAQFGPHGEPFEEPRFTFGESGEGSFTRSIGVAVNEATGDVYVAGGSNRQGPVEIFGPALNYPAIATGAAEHVLPAEATLTGTINPEGEPVEECTFEYGETTAYGSSVPCAQSPAQIGSSTQPVEVSALTTGLTVGDGYHFRLVVTARHTALRGVDAGFHTPNSPLVQGSSAASVRGTSATVAAEVDPRYGHTTYRFEYGPTSSYGMSIPVPDASAGSGSGYVPVSAGLTGLQAGTVYHFRIVASNIVGTVEGPDVTLRTPGASGAGQEACPNAPVRAAQGSGYLAECRAYELVSPVDKNGGDVATSPGTTQAAADGEAIKFTSTALFGDAIGSEVRGGEYIAQRGTEGWATHAINPLQKSNAAAQGSTQQYEYLSPNLDMGVYYALSPVTGGSPNVDQSANLYLRSDPLTAGAGSYHLISDSNEPLPPRSTTELYEEIVFSGISRDHKRIFFESEHNLTPEADKLGDNQPKLYEWHEGTLKLVGILPNGQPTPSTAGPRTGAHQGYGGGWTESAISADGTHVVFTAAPFTKFNNGLMYAGTLYMRIDGRETVQIDASERTDCNVERREAEPSYECTGTPEPDPEASHQSFFLGASADEGRVFFQTNLALTDDAHGGSNLYMYDDKAPAGHRLTLISGSSLWVPAVSDDGTFVYFTSSKALHPGDPEPGNRGNLYVWHGGETRLVASINEGTCIFFHCWGLRGREAGDDFTITPDGGTIVFDSEDPALAERFGVASPEVSGVVHGVYVYEHFREVYVYQYATNSLACASCNKARLPLSSTAEWNGTMDAYLLWIEHTTMYRSDPLSSDGRHVFFDTGEPLVPEDTNGMRDVYEYDVETGQVHLISNGSCACDSVFADATPDASNVFFVTHGSLVAGDEGSSADLYDARVDGGFLAQSAQPPSPCSGEECQPPAGAASSLAGPSSASFAGAGNQAQPGANTRTGGKSTPRGTRAQRLARALRACAKRPRGRRASCRARARHRYGGRFARGRKANSSTRDRGGRA